MRNTRDEFIEWEGRQVKIVKNLKVNVLENSQKLLPSNLSKCKIFPKPTNQPENTLSDDEEVVMKPVRVDIRPLGKEFTEVGVFYGSDLFPELSERIYENTIHQTSNEPEQPLLDVSGFRKDDAENINDCDIDETESEIVIDIDDSSESETVEESQVIQRISEKGLTSCTGTLEKEGNAAMKVKNFDTVELKGLLSESEEKLENRKMKITSLKISLANMERKNAEKKLSIQKRDRKIRDLEEIIKIKDDELSSKNALILKLQKENNLLSKFKASLKPIEKVPGILEVISAGNPKLKNTEIAVEGTDVSANSCEEMDMKENAPDAPRGETDPISEFLTLIAQVKTVIGQEENSQQDMSDASRIKNGGCNIQEFDKDDDVIMIDDDLNDTVAITSSDDERYLVISEGEEDNILIPTLEHHPNFSMEGGLTFHEGIVDPFLRLKPFASMCAKTPNIVERESKKRKKFHQIQLSPRVF